MCAGALRAQGEVCARPPAPPLILGLVEQHEVDGVGGVGQVSLDEDGPATVHPRHGRQRCLAHLCRRVGPGIRGVKGVSKGGCQRGVEGVEGVS